LPSFFILITYRSFSFCQIELVISVQGQGSRLIDEAGKSYLDTRNNVAHVGHGNPHVVKAVQEQVAILNTNTRYLHPNMAQLAERLITQWFPDTDLQVVIFVNSGSEANDLALRLARAHTGSKNTIVVDGACKSKYNIFDQYRAFYKFGDDHTDS
jgi:ethanolamine-phosphate phospho-lyase